jgi:4-amino-4-deoxy-L-arabinose transferase-like glycosyltransferase
MVWQEARRAEAEQQYRALNAPLSKYVLGLGRSLAGHGPAEVSVDWNWSLTWEQNRARGAVPAEPVLSSARAASTALLAVSLVLMYLCGLRIGGRSLGLLAAILLGLNALVLLHGRRAMSEGTLIFAVCLAMWGMLRTDRRPWLAGLATALAFCAKHSALALWPVGLVAVIWRGQPGQADRSWHRVVAACAAYVGTAAVVVVVLNPLLWSDPLGAGLEALEARRELVQEQIQAQAEVSPVRLPMNAADRVSAMIAQLFLTPLQFEELPNYAAELSPSVAAYSRSPLHNLLRGWTAGSVFLGITLAGLLIGIARVRSALPALRRDLSLMALATLAQAGVLLFTVPFPYQRYYLPLVPLCGLWAALALAQLAELTKRLPIRRAA